MIVSGRGTTRAEDAHGTPTQSHISPSILVYEDKYLRYEPGFRGGRSSSRIHRCRESRGGNSTPPSSRLASPAREREFFIVNLLVRIHFIIVMIRWTGLAPWECEFPFPGSLAFPAAHPASRLISRVSFTSWPPLPTTSKPAMQHTMIALPTVPPLSPHSCHDDGTAMIALQCGHTSDRLAFPARLPASRLTGVPRS